MFNPFSLEGKTILVTGASSGIGRAIAIALSQMGATVIATARNEKRLSETVSNFEGTGHTQMISDLCDENSVSDLISQLPKLNGIVHCAGIGDRTFCKEIDEAKYDQVLNSNLKAPILLQSKILQAKKMQKGSSIVFIASRAANSPSVGNALYSASKGGMISYAKCLGLELASRQIRVNCICPAMVWTDLILQGGITREDMEQAQLNYPLKRYGKPEDIANLTIYLLSDASAWMTGSCVDITGGAKGL